MGYPTPSIGSNGQGIWDGSQASGTPAGSSMSSNALSGVADGATTITPGNNSPDMSGADQGSGAANKPTPNENLLSTVGSLSPNQLSGNGSAPSPDQSLLSTVGTSKNAPTRISTFGGTEKGIQTQ